MSSTQAVDELPHLVRLQACDWIRLALSPLRCLPGWPFLLGRFLRVPSFAPLPSSFENASGPWPIAQSWVSTRFPTGAFIHSATSATAPSFRRRLAPAPKTRMRPPLGSSTAFYSRRPAGSGRLRRGDQCDHFVPAFPFIPARNRVTIWISCGSVQASRSRLRRRSAWRPPAARESLPACHWWYSAPHARSDPTATAQTRIRLCRRGFD